MTSDRQCATVLPGIDMARHNIIGAWGEQIAVDFFVRKGFAIVAHDEHFGKKEVDIIAIKDDHIHFVEVKTRSNPDDDPLDAITSAKRSRLTRFADGYLRSYGLPLIPQFDIVAINGSPDEGVLKFEYLPDAFFPSRFHR